jgi:hypothetical protein
MEAALSSEKSVDFCQPAERHITEYSSLLAHRRGTLKLEILPVPCQCILSVMNFIVNNKKIFIHSHLYTILIEGTSTILIDQMPTYLVLKKAHFMLASEFSRIYHVV